MKKKLEKISLLYFNDNIINFCFQYNFEKEGKYSIKILLKKPLSNLNFMFSHCSSLTSLIYNNVTDMSDMFSYCSSLTSLNISNINSNNVNNMSDMFYYCSSLTSLNSNDKKI